MGRAWSKLEVAASVSRHNSEEDRQDDALWEKFCTRVQEMANEDEFKDLVIDVTWYHG